MSLDSGRPRSFLSEELLRETHFLCVTVDWGCGVLYVLGKKVGSKETSSFLVLLLQPENTEIKMHKPGMLLLLHLSILSAPCSAGVRCVLFCLQWEAKRWHKVKKFKKKDVFDLKKKIIQATYIYDHESSDVMRCSRERSLVSPSLEHRPVTRGTSYFANSENHNWLISLCYLWKFYNSNWMFLKKNNSHHSIKNVN